MCKFAYDFSIGIPLNLSIYGKDPNLKIHTTLYIIYRFLFKSKRITRLYGVK